MFPLVVLMFLLSLLAGFSSLSNGAFPAGPLLGAALTGLVIWIVRQQRAAHPEAFFDWVQGGVTGILQDDSRTIRWRDWEVLLSRHGEIDLLTRTLKIERRACCDLIPWGTVERSLDEFYNVTETTSPDSSGCRLELRASDTRHELVLDVGHGRESAQGRAMIRQLRTRLQELVTASGRTASRRASAAGGLAQRMLTLRERGRRLSAMPSWARSCELGHQGREARRDHLLFLQSALDGARYVRSSRSQGWIHGTYSGRALTVAAWISDTDAPDADQTHYTLQVETTALLRVRRPADRLRISTDASDPYEVVSYLRSRNSDELGHLLRELFDQLGCQELTIEQGTLYVDKAAHPLDLCPVELHKMIDCMTRLAEQIEQLSASLVSNLVAHEQTRCPFCRDDLRPGEETLVACVDCGTQHHDECFADLGECTIRGCSSVRAEPVGRSVERSTRPRGLDR